MAVRQRISVEEYLALPEEKPYLEYENGEVVQKVAPDIRHTRLAGKLIIAIGNWDRDSGGTVGPEGRVEFEAADGTYFRLPDVAFWAPDRPIEGERAMRPPTLAAEIRSPGQSIESLRERCAFLRRNGVDVCWLIDPDSRTVEVFEAENVVVLGANDTLSSPSLPGFTLPLSQYFAVLDR
jgi:Uma2 family endonuclease